MKAKAVVLAGNIYYYGTAPSGDEYSARTRKDLCKYVGKIGNVRDFTQSACLVKFDDGKNFWIEDIFLKQVDIRDLIRRAIDSSEDGALLPSPEPSRNPPILGFRPRP